MDSSSDSETGQYISKKELELLREQQDTAATLGIEPFDQQKKQVLNALMLEKLKTFQYPASFHWLEKMVITSSSPINPLISENDKLRELEFNTQALHAAKKARELFKRFAEPFDRPDDYFAEMVKTDTHMLRVRKEIINSNERIEKSLEARKKRELKKTGKAIQNKVQLERAIEKRKALEHVKQLRKKADHLHGDDNIEIDLERTMGNKKSTPNYKRMAKDKRYGGGRKSDKRNDAKTVGSTKEFNPRIVYNRTIAGGPSKKKAAPASAKRPGKSKRAAASRS